MAGTGDPRTRVHLARTIFVIVMVIVPILFVYLMYQWSNSEIGISYDEIEREQEAIREMVSADLEEELRKDILFTAKMAANTIDPDLVHEAVSSGNDLDTSYLELKAILKDIMSLNPLIDDIYIMIRGPDPDRFLFLVCGYDTADLDGDGTIADDELAPDMFEEYYVGDKPQMKRSFEGPCTDATMIIDRWGTFLSGYAPIIDGNGTSIAIVGVDYMASSIEGHVSIILSSYDRSIIEMREGHERTQKTLDLLAVMFVILSAIIGVGIGTIVFNRTERALREEIDRKSEIVGNSEERLRKVFEHSTDGIITLDGSLNVTSCNRAMLDLLGGDDDIKGRNIKDFSSAILETISRVQDRQKRLGKEERIVPYVVSVPNLSGEDRFIKVRCDSIGRIDGSLEYLFMVTDITRERHAFEMLKRSEKKYRAIIENSMDNIYICESSTGKIMESNRSIQMLLGYSEEEMRNRTAFDFLDHEECDVKEHIRMVVKQGRSRIKRRRYRKKDGSLIEIEATCSHIKDNGSDLLCVVSRDMTERNEYERRLLEERNRAELYLDILSHDIGNLHHGIMGFIGLARLRGSNPQRVRSYLDSIDSLTSRSVHLVENVMLLNRLQSIVPKFSGMDLEKMILQSVESVKKSFPSKDVTFEVRSSPMPLVKAFPAIESVLYNLLHNAVKYQTKGGPFVEIDAGPAGEDKVLVRIRDHGPGIPAEMREEVFNRASLNRKQGGIGLSLVKMLVSHCGGKVWIEDPDDRGAGAVFNVELPIFM